MQNSEKKYPAKLLLFGEYTVLHGGAALAMPYAKYSGYWRFLKTGESASYSLQSFIKYLHTARFPEGALDVIAFEKDVAAGLIFDSTIPTGYGAGSSGSLCAAIWDRYGQGAEDVKALQANFILMESFFHGKSSGLDPLVSYLNLPVLQKGNTIQVLGDFPIPKEIEVYDSGISRSTAPLVEWYRQEYAQNEAFKNQVLEVLLPQNTVAILALVAQESLTLKKAFKVISDWQFQYLGPLVPESVRVDWMAARKDGRFFKICGAGGGGFYLVF